LEKKLRTLYALQLIDSHLDELEEMKGDLPGEVKDLEEQHAHLQEQLSALERTMRESFARRDTTDGEIVTLGAKGEKYKAQQLHVKNNKEYDALTKELDFVATTIEKLKKEMDVLEGKATLARTDSETTKAAIAEIATVLEEKREALGEISKTTEEEELKFQHERQKIVKIITRADLATYEKIRRARKGKAVVPIRRGACGGCFNRVPPQKILELRQNNKVYACEHCGRILVSDEIAEGSSATA
jgi:predicted  nucleic acid-binding Zn-ribbon protein